MLFLWYILNDLQVDALVAQNKTQPLSENF